MSEKTGLPTDFQNSFTARKGTKFPTKDRAATPCGGIYKIRFIGNFILSPAATKSKTISQDFTNSLSGAPVFWRQKCNYYNYKSAQLLQATLDTTKLLFAKLCACLVCSM